MTDEQPTSRRAARQKQPASTGGTTGGTPDATQAADSQATDAATPVGPRGFRKHPTAWIISAAALAFVLMGTGAVFAGVASASGQVVTAPTPSASVEPPRPTPTGTPAAASRLRTCSIAALAADPRLMAFEGTVVKATTGEVLFDRNGTTPSRTGSVMKVFTAAAALSALGPDFQISTTVVEGSTPGSIVLIGRGDPTLSVGGPSVYAGAPQLSDLAAQTVANYAARHPGTPITSLVIDASYWNVADKWDPSWKRSEQTIGYHSEVTPLMVDGDRANPARGTSPRSTDPVGRAAAAFKSALLAADSGDVVASDVAISGGTAVGGAAVIGEVRSQPVRVLVGQMLPTSDNTLAENLARIVSKVSGFNGSAASLQQAIPSALAAYGVDPTGLVIRDGSGLSEFNGVPSQTMAKFNIQVMNGVNNLDVVKAALPIAGQTGTLASRFSGGAADARGRVFAKTGWIDTAYSLSGIIDSADATPLTFTFYAVGAGIRDNAKAALDLLAAGAYRCGDNLSNN